MFKKEIYSEHINLRQAEAEKALAAFDLPGLVYTSGSQAFFYGDDQEKPFRPFHHMAHWLPISGPNHGLVIRPGEKPILFYFQPQDFWHDHLPLSDEFWLSEFTINIVTSHEELWEELAAFKGFSYLGPDAEQAAESGLVEGNEDLNAFLNWYRAYKSEYEVHCLDMASAKAAKGHEVAKDVFLAGGSEFDIHMAYLKAVGQLENQLPYNPIIGLNEKAAVLHYEAKRQNVKDGKVLLIDAGAKFNGYGSDITRTHIASNVHPKFKELLAALNQAQIEQCQSVEPGINVGALNHRSHLDLARILLNHDLLSGGEPEDLVAEGLTKPFYPHGIGHMLGILVHDVGGRQLDQKGTIAPPNKEHPTLRTERHVEPGFVFTVEPGLYFIDFLLAPYRTNSFKGRFNWPLIDDLLPLGGIRIEDNVLVTKEGVKNLTRQYLP